MAYSPVFGPKLVMLNGMIRSDFLVFAAFALVTLLAYGFASHAVINALATPNTKNPFLVS